MTVESILSTIEIKRPDLTRQEARAVATDVFYSGEAVEDILASSTLDKLINGYKSRQSAMAKSVTANDPKVCPVCKVPLKPVKLANDRKAVFCSKHFVVFPVPPSKEGE